MLVLINVYIAILAQGILIKALVRKRKRKKGNVALGRWGRVDVGNALQTPPPTLKSCPALICIFIPALVQMGPFVGLMRAVIGY